jgi:1-acyl-sn-glycerol-3-phosphate acyltransferase
VKRLALLILRRRGWRFTGELPDLPRLIMIGAPHTSNWDFVVFLAAMRHYAMKVRYIGKDSLFRWPFGLLFRHWGGIPVDRSRPGGVTAAVAEEMDRTERTVLVIAPEGTRSPAPYWRSGFIQIAQRTGAPVLLAYIDGLTKTAGMGPLLAYEGDTGVFMDQVRLFYADKAGIRPEGKGPVRLKDEA